MSQAFFAKGQPVQENAGATTEPADELLEEYVYDSLFGDAEVFTMETDEGEPIRVLYVGGGFQSASYLGERRFEPVFEYYRAFDHLFEAPLDVRQVLMIGGGAYSYPKHLLTTRENVAIDVVEIDPAVVEIARQHFFVDELEKTHGPQGSGRLRTIVADGVYYIAQRATASTDAIINDSFDGTNPTGLLLTPESIAHAKRCLTPGGLYLLNAVVDEEDTTQAVGAAMTALADHFAYVYEIPCIDLEFSGADNYLVIATDTPCFFSGVTSVLCA